MILIRTFHSHIHLDTFRPCFLPTHAIFWSYWNAITKSHTILESHISPEMSRIVQGTLSIFRKSEPSKPLHPRWGDVDISAPTDGSWNQYDNPHRSDRQRSLNRLGHVPGVSPHRNLPQVRKADYDDDNRSVRSASSSVSHRSISSLESKRSGRPSVRLASRLKGHDNKSRSEDSHHGSSRTGFRYRPIQSENKYQQPETSTPFSSRFKYIPTSERYLQPRTARSESLSSSHSSHAESVDGSFDSSQISRTSTHDGTQVTQSSRSSVLSPARWITPVSISTPRKSASFVQPMTMTMVPDSDELYGWYWIFVYIIGIKGFLMFCVLSPWHGFGITISLNDSPEWKKFLITLMVHLVDLML